MDKFTTLKQGYFGLADFSLSSICGRRHGDVVEQFAEI
jgi:hypothetical protein